MFSTTENLAPQTQVVLGGSDAKLTTTTTTTELPRPEQIPAEAANSPSAIEVAGPAKSKNAGEMLKMSLNRALGGGTAGALAMGINVSTLMWLRTTVNYQYRYGTSTLTALKTLYSAGGVRRFYRGFAPALLQGPLSRFGDTAANTGVLAFLDSNETTAGLNVGLKTVLCSVTAGAWRILLMPIDTTKTIMQVEGKQGFSKLVSKVKSSRPTVLYHGALASSSATIVGHYPWFMTFNLLQEFLPKPDSDADFYAMRKLGRNALIGFSASVVSDTCSNSIRVLKVYKQASTVPVTYVQAVTNVVRSDGVLGLLGRGLKTKILANGFQSVCFSVLWKYIDETFMKK